MLIIHNISRAYHGQVLMGSYDRLLELIRRSNAISPVVASETATALQVLLKIEHVDVVLCVNLQ